MSPRVLFAVLAIPAAFGHDLEVNFSLAAPAVILHATYAGTEPVPFAKVQLYAPADAQHEFQAGNTDKHGNFSFVPDSPGAWKAVVDDELGHRKETSVQVPDPFTSHSQILGARGASRVERAVTGIAILLGCTGFWYGFQARKRT